MKRFDELEKELDSKYGAKAGGKQSSAAPTTRFEMLTNTLDHKYNVAPTVDDSFINTFIRDVDAYYGSAERDWNRFELGNANSVYSDRSDKTANLRYRSKAIRKYMDENTDLYDEETYKSLMSFLDSFDKDSDESMAGFRDARDYWNSPESVWYNKYNEMSDKNQAISIRDLQAKYEELSAEGKTRDAAWIEDELNFLYTYGGESAQAAGRAAANEKTLKRIEQLNQEIREAQAAGTDGRQFRERKLIDQLTAERDALQAEATLYSRTYGVMDSYQPLGNESDFAVLSNVRPQNPTRNDLQAYDAYGGEAPVVDRLGLFLNASEQDREDAMAVPLDFEGTWDTVIKDGMYGSWDQLTEREINTYYYLLNKEGQNRADQYLEEMKTELNRRSTAAWDKQYESADPLQKLARNIVSIPGSVFGGVPAFIEDAIRMAQGKDINPYSAAHALSNEAQIVREDTAEAADKMTGNASVLGITLGDAYQAAMSGADSLFGAAFLGSTGYGVAMGMGAASSKSRELYERGASNEQIAAGGLLAGAAEAVFEKYSIEKFFDLADSKTVGQMVKNALAQGGIEASEEAFTEIANTITDALVMGNQSAWNQRIMAYMADGKSEAEATALALLDVGKDVWKAGAGGFISGVLMGGGGSAASYAGYQADLRQQGQDILESGDFANLRALAVEMAGGDARMQKAANKATESWKHLYSTDAGDSYKSRMKQAAKDTGRLSAKLDAATSKQNLADLQSALEEKGLTPRAAKAAARTLNIMVDGGQLTDKQMAKIQASKEMTAVLEDVAENPESSVAKRSLKVALAKLGITVTEGKTGGVSGPRSNTEAPAVEYSVSEAGKTVMAKTGEEVEIKRVSSIKNGQMQVQLKDGSIVSADDVEFATEGEALVYGTLAAMNVHAEAANQILAAFDPADGVSAEAYAAGVREAYTYGSFSYPAQDMMSTGQFSKDLTPAQRNTAYTMGKLFGAKKAETAQAVLKGQKQQAKKDGGVKKTGAVHFDRNGRTFNQKQEAALATMDALSAALGVDFYVYESYENKDGKRVYKAEDGSEQHAPNAFYLEDGSIHVDLNAGADASGTMLFAVSHELTHFIRQWSPEKFKILADFLFEQYGKKGVSVKELVDNQIAKAQRNGRTIDEDTAYEEVVADSMEAMLADGKAAEKLAALKARDKSLWQKIKDFFTELAEKIRSAYEGLKPDSVEGRYVAEMIDALDQIQDLFVEAVADAGSTYQAVAARVAEGKPITPEQEVKHSLRRDEELAQNAVNVNATTDYVEEDVMKKAIEARAVIRKLFRDPAMQEQLRLPPDIEGDTLILNSSYGGTEENTTVCIRSMAAQAFMDEVSKQLGRPLTVEDTLVISQEIMNWTDKPECLYCYVATDRRAYRDFLGTYMKQRQGALDGLRSGTDKAAAFETFRGKRKSTKEMRTRFDVYNKIADGKIAGITEADLASLEDLFTEIATLTQKSGMVEVELNRSMKKKSVEGFVNDVTESGGMTREEAYRLWQLKDAANYAQSASWAKKMVGYTAYNGHILKWTQKRIDDFNSHYGLRMYSFSDFSPAFILENMQMLTDAAVRGLKVLAYTKELPFVQIFAKTGANINISVFAYEQNGMIAEDAMQGASWAEAKKLRDQYPNVGITLVATSDKILQWGLEQDFVDVVIPYHLVRTGQNVADYFGYKNYTKVSADGKQKGIKFKKGDKTSIYPHEHNNDLVQYVKALEKYHLTPRFADHLTGYEAFLAGEMSEADFRAANPYYMKLVNETRRSAADTPSVQPVFDTKAAKAAINDMIKAGGYYVPVGQSLENQNEIASEVADKLRGAKRSDRDAAYMAAAESGDMETAQRMVDEAAKAAGYTTEAYHGTNADFTFFDKNRLGKGLDQYGSGFYFGSNRGISENYGDKIYSTYLKLENPFRLSVTYGSSGSLRDVKITKKQAAAILKRHPLMGTDESPLGDFYEEFWETGAKAWMINDLAGKYTSLGYLEGDLFKDYPNEFHEAVRDVTGHDGVAVYLGARDTFAVEDPEYIYVAWFDDQMKSSEPITKDDNGNIIPLSQRFNTETNDIRYSDRDYSYEGLISKPDMVVTTAPDVVPANRADVIVQAKKNAATIGKINPKNGSVSVHVKDIDTDVVVGKSGLKHAIDYRYKENAPVIMKAGEILANSIRINELTPERKDADDAYALIGAAKRENGDFCVVLSVVNRYSNELESMDALYSFNTKKGNRLRSMRPGFQGPVTDSTISIEELLEYVNTYFPYILPESVLRHFGHDARPEGNLGESALFSDRDPMTEKVNQVLQKENAKLKDDVSSLKELLKLQGQVTNGTKFTKTSVEAVAANLMKYADATGDKKELAGILNQYYEQISSTDEQTLDGILQSAAPAVNWLMEHRTDRKMNPSDLDRVLGGRLTAGDLELAVYDSYWNVSTLYTVADRKQKEIDTLKDKNAQQKVDLKQIQQNINQLKIDHNKRIRELQASYKKEIANLEQEHKAAIDTVKREYREDSLKKQQAIKDHYKELREKNVESRNRTVMRNKIKRVVKDLNQMLLTNSKDKHVMANMQMAVASALDAINMDTVGAEERVAMYNEMIANAKTEKQKAELTKTRDNIQEHGDKLATQLAQLKSAYSEIKNSDDPILANSHDEVIESHLEQVVQMVGNTSLRDMNMAQLQAVYDMYKMVLTRVRDANKAFKAAKGESIAQLGDKVVTEVGLVGGKHDLTLKGVDGIKGFIWNNLKPIYAFRAIGSNTLTSLFNNVRAGEDVWAVDVAEARAFYLEKTKKYGYDKWDFKKQYSFVSSGDVKFKLSLEQIMSLYAYSKRDQADKHLEKGGFVFDSAIEVVEKKHGIPVTYTVNTAAAHNLDFETLTDIISKLTPEQRSFVDEMQAYLSDVMGGKGNEVSMEMYGVKLFNEKNYFPLKSAQQFMAKAKEQQKGEVKIKNSGFSKKTVTNASNPIILANFMDVWAEHVNDMSMYHAFVLPLEDFYRVYNFKTAVDEETETKSVDSAIQSAYGKAATRYIDQLLKDLNGGARSDPAAGIINKGMAAFKKGAVFASASVVIQQPSAIARATAYIDTKYFIGPKVDKQRHAKLWEEVKKYAPVAMIKEMGYFDTNMGKSTTDYITAKEYDTLGEKAKALVTDSGFRDEALSKAPALADEIAWCAIWEAVKRETKAKHPDLKVGSEAFLQAAGQRFTEVIVNTQVYDSILSRSAMMRSKDTGVKMATAFMAEPTTSINMVADALIQGKRGNKKFAVGAIGSVVAAQILNSFLVSFVYAARDDDEDKTYLEKYVENFTGEMLDSLNPADYIPFIKDIVSIVKGYDVERSDMAVISDLWKAWEQLSSDKVSAWKKVENFAGGIAQLFGLPVKNIMRDVRAAWQAASPLLYGTTQKSTKAGLANAVKAGITGKDMSDQQQLYEAMISGDQVQLERVQSRYKDQSAIDSAVRKALREYDPRIHDAAQAKYNGDLSTYMEIAREIIAEGHFKLDYVVTAINNEEAQIKKGVEGEGTSGGSRGTSMFAIKDFVTAVASGEAEIAKTAMDDIIQSKVKDGKTKRAAEDAFQAAAVTALHEAYNEQTITKEQAINALITYADKDPEDAKKSVREWASFVETGIKYDGLKDAYLDGEVSFDKAVEMRVKYGGQKKDDAKATVLEWKAYSETGIVYDDLKDEFMDGTVSAAKAVDMMVKYGGETKADAETDVSNWKFEKSNGYRYDQRGKMFKDGQLSAEELLEITMSHGGKTEKEAKQELCGYVSGAYQDGLFSREQTIDLLVEYGGKDEVEAEIQVQVYDWKAEYPEMEELTVAAVEDYNTYCEGAGIDKTTYYDAWRHYCETEPAYDKNGDTVRNSVTKKVMPYIDSLDLTPKQKTALALCWWKISTINRYKLW